MNERNALLIEKSLKIQDTIGKGCQNNSQLIQKNMKLHALMAKNFDIKTQN